MINFDNRRLKQEYNELMKMREISIGEDVPFHKQVEIREEQMKRYKHYKFMMGLKDAIKKGGDVNDLVVGSNESKRNKKEIHGGKKL